MSRILDEHPETAKWCMAIWAGRTGRIGIGDPRAVLLARGASRAQIDKHHTPLGPPLVDLARNDAPVAARAVDPVRQDQLAGG